MAQGVRSKAKLKVQGLEFKGIRENLNGLGSGFY
jgi:hypothetical protein